MTTPTDPAALAGRPVILAARRTNDLMAPRYADETPDACGRCGAAVMVGPRTRRLLTERSGAVVRCYPCVVDLARAAGGTVLTHLGGPALPPEVN